MPIERGTILLGVHVAPSHASEIFTFINQFRLIGIATVRLKIGGKRFEIICCRNKAVSRRNKEEKDHDEVLQSSYCFF
ncbi:unnamed protein product [Rotaria sp. Silwood2]|nr:unnamed protein product [Rotaria sp. Silwood2]